MGQPCLGTPLLGRWYRGTVRRMMVLLVVSVAAVIVLVVSGAEGEAPSPSRQADEAAVLPAVRQSPRSRPFVASSAIPTGRSGDLLALPGLGGFAGRCTSQGRAQIVYRASPRSSTQQVTWETVGSSGGGRVDPGERLTARFGRGIGRRVEWQTGDYSKASIRVATASFAVGNLVGAPDTCLITAKADLVLGSR